MPEFFISARVGAAIVHAAAALGADPAVLAASVGFDPSQADDPEALMSSAIEDALWREGARLLNDQDFRFLCPVNTIVWPREALERSVHAADAALSRVLSRHADALLAALPNSPNSFADRLRAWLVRNLEDGEVSLARSGRFAAERAQLAAAARD